MARYRRWVFEANATRDEFLRHLARGLARRGFAVTGAKMFDLGVVGGGARGWIKVLHHAHGLDVVLKEKASLLGRPEALSDAVLAAGREAQARILRSDAADAPHEVGP